MKFKYILTTFAAAGALMLTSCEGMLDIPQHSVSPVEGYYDTDAGAEEGITAVYGMMRSLENGMCAFSQFKDFLSDDVWTGGGSHYDGTFYMLNDYTFGTEYGTLRTVYGNLYNMIYAANVVIENVTGDSDVMRRAVAEAKVFRAYAYFQLVTLWGPAPLVDHTLSEDEYMQGNSTVEKLWQFIETDLTDAINSGALTEKTNLNDKTARITKQFAQAMLGKSYLFQEKFQDAAQVLDEVIDSGLYDLNPDLSNQGTPDGPLSYESLFEINSLQDNTQSSNNNMRWTFMGLRGEKYSYTDENIFASSTFGYMNPRKELYDDFVAVEGEDGYRLNQTIKTREQMAQWCTNIMEITDNEGYWCYKYRILSQYWAGYFYANNIRVMKFNEVLLLAAEAHVRGNYEADKAVEYFNRIRTRAQAPTVSSVTFEDIKRELRLETCFDGCRYQNLIRWGDAATELAHNGEQNPALQPDGTVTWQRYNDNTECGFKVGKHELLPFPATEMNVNPNMTQNPGWGGGSAK